MNIACKIVVDKLALGTLTLVFHVLEFRVVTMAKTIYKPPFLASGMLANQSVAQTGSSDDLGAGMGELFVAGFTLGFESGRRASPVTVWGVSKLSSTLLKIDCNRLNTLKKQ